MPDTKKNKTKAKQSSAVIRNAKLLYVLSYIPEFKEDVKKIREEFKIDPKKFQKDDNTSVNEMYTSCIHKWFVENNELYFTTDLPVGFFSDEGARPFWNRIQKLGDKFNLQYNFIHSMLYGVPYYIFTDRLVVPARNWAIDTELRNDGGSPRWFSVRLYAPLLGSELQEGYREAEVAFNGNTKIKSPVRSGDAFIEILDYIDLLVMPKKKVGTYESGRYEEILIGNTVAEIAKEAKMSAHTMEKTWKRLNDFSEETFNFKIKPTEH